MQGGTTSSGWHQRIWLRLLEDEACRELNASRAVDGVSGHSEAANVVGLQVGLSEGVFVEGIQELRFDCQGVVLIERELLDDAQIVVEVGRQANFASRARQAGGKSVRLIQPSMAVGE